MVSNIPTSDGRPTHVKTRDSKMKLRVGYELQYHFPQPSPVILMLNIHFTRVSDLAAPDHIIINPSVPISGYRDGFGNWCSRIVRPCRTGTHLNRCRRERYRTARSIRSRCEPGSGRTTSGGDTRLPLGEPFLRQRPTARSGLEIVRARNTGLGARPSHLRFGTSAYLVRLRACAGNEDGIRSLWGTARCLPRLRALGRGVLPGVEHSGPILHRLSRRHGHTTTLSAWRFRRLVRGLCHRPLVHIRPEE